MMIHNQSKKGPGGKPYTRDFRSDSTDNKDKSNSRPPEQKNSMEIQTKSEE